MVDLKYKWQSLDCSKAQIELDGADVGTHEIDDEDFYKWYFEWLGFRTISEEKDRKHEKDILIDINVESYTCGDGCCFEMYHELVIEGEEYGVFECDESEYFSLLKWMRIELVLEDDSDYEEME